MDGFDLEAVAPAFHGGIVVAIAFFAHAANQMVFSEKFLVAVEHFYPSKKIIAI
ncbi:MAG: hypothetical protein HOO93_17835 [Methyloglobulus sp.]|nr:hypothetical protein [Methyloglobulus sp.]